MTQKLLNRYGGAVPRYTSYPTAPHFHDGVNPDTYEKWLTELPEGEPLSLYLHVPFCHEMCWYCGCQTKIFKRYSPVADYAKHLALEIEHVSKLLGDRHQVQHIHWGGGTPTALSNDDFSALMARIKTQFRIASDAEIAIEIDPRTMTEQMAETLAVSGINRASLGVQDFNPTIQQAINRVQSFEQTKDVTDWLKAVGIKQINLDLMYGLPLQTVQDVRRTVDLSMELDADRFSVFGYAHVPWMKSHQKLILEDQLPDGEERMAQAEAIADQLQQHGYEAIGLDHFARPDDSMAQALKSGKLHRNFQGYTTDAAPTLIGLGASSIGRLPKGYAQNTSSERAYKEAISNGRLPIVRGIELSEEDNLRRHIIERLMCDLFIDLADLCAKAGTNVDTFSYELEQLREMNDDGIVHIRETQIQITEIGQPFVRAVCAVFDQYLGTGQGRHSRAV